MVYVYNGNIFSHKEKSSHDIHKKAGRNNYIKQNNTDSERQTPCISHMQIFKCIHDSHMERLREKERGRGHIVKINPCNTVIVTLSPTRFCLLESHLTNQWINPLMKLVLSLSNLLPNSNILTYECFERTFHF